jgi:hypothetical protein
VNIFKDVCSDNCVQICVHEVKNQVDVSVILSSDNILESNDIFVTSQLLQKDDFSECTLCISGVLKSVEILF